MRGPFSNPDVAAMPPPWLRGYAPPWLRGYAPPWLRGYATALTPRLCRRMWGGAPPRRWS